MKVYVTMPHLHVYGGHEYRKEIYVISFASDLHGQSNHRPPAVGAANETLHRIAPEESKFFVVSISNLFHRVTKKHPVSLSGDGIVLYPPADPQGMMGIHLAVVESDSDIRDFGKLLSQIFGNQAVKALLSEAAGFTAAAGGLPAPLLTALFRAVVAVVPVVLKANKDDILFTHNHSGVAFNGYGGCEDGTEYLVANDAVRATLRVWTKEGE